MTKILGHIKSNVIAYLALFVALGGTSYAAIKIPAGSVGNRQLKNHSVSPIKLQTSSIAGYVRAWAQIDSAGTIVASRPRAHLVTWNSQSAFAPGGLVSWGEAIPADCVAIATTGTSGVQSTSASASISSAGSKNGLLAGAYVRLSASQTPVAIAVICPQP
jgi:hypothetical protein